MPSTSPNPTPPAGPPVEPRDAQDALASRVLDHLARTVFASGLDPSIVERRWSATREAFGEFALRDVAAMDDDDVEILAHDPRVIRNRSKLRAVIDNAARLEEILEVHGSADAWLETLRHDDARATERLISTFRYVGPAGAPGLLSRLLSLDPTTG